MATIKVHSYSDEDGGWVSCDYRGQGELQGDHDTLYEEEFGPDVETNDRIEEVLADGPAWNRMTAKLLKGMIPAGPLGDLLGKVAEGKGVRIGVFDH